MASQAPVAPADTVAASDPLDPFTSGLRRLRRWGRRALLTVVAIGLVAVAVSAVARVETNRLWFDSLGDGAVYATRLRAELLLGIVAALLAGGLGALAVVLVNRTAPAPWPREEDEQARGWRAWVEAHPVAARRLVLAVFTLVPAYRLGTAASGSWQQYLLWRHAVPWGTTDPTYHRDLSYYVEIYPWHRTVVGLLSSMLTWAIVATIVAALVHGSLRLRGPGRRVTRPLIAQTSALLAAWLLVHAGSYWLDRMALTTSNRGPVTGAGYTDTHAVGPGRIGLIVVVVLVALALAANVVLRRGRLLAGAVALTVVASLLFATAWPALVQHLKEQPSAATLDLPQIRRNQQATAAAFGIGDVTVQEVGATDGAARPSLAALTRQALDDTQLRALDPNRLTPTFDVKQQLQAYYGFKNTLDVDRYPLGGRTRDVAIGVRELHAGNVSRSTWATQHLVYTHGYGVVAAPIDSIDPTTGVPTFLDGGLPPEQQIPVTQPRVYFGQNSPSYSIVGQPQGAAPVEFDHPAGAGTDAAATHTTYTGGGGVPIGSWWHRLLYATTSRSPQILLSSGINADSRILTVRDPRARVAALAPWLTLDGDVYPVVVDGDIEWVVDGYTTASTYPDAQQVDLHQATTSTLTAQGASVAQPHGAVNYMRDSVKATVDAYTGEVHLYAWDQAAHPDPLLTAWTSVDPGLIEPESAIPAALLPHLRYPQDLFDVQRQLLTKYHVTDAADFYSGNDFWSVPTDPTVAATQQLNSSSTYTPPARTPSDPSVYQTLSADGTSKATFALSTPLVTLNHHDLAGFLSVDSTPGADYGHLTLLRFPSGTGVGSPAQVQNDIESTTRISEALTLQRGGNSKVVLGQLVAVPLQGQMLYVEPIYTQAQGSNSFPILRHVVAVYGDGDPAFTTGLDSAVRQAIASGERAAS